MTRFLLLTFLVSALSAQVRYEDILKGPNENWLTYAGDFASQRYSSLTQIHRGNVGSLVPKWIHHVEGASRLEASPIVFDGVMYATNNNEVFALDAITGRRIWRYRPERVEQDRVNKGVAILGDRILFTTADAHLVALHRITGNVLWDKQYAPPKQGYFSTVAPLVTRDLAIVGVGGGGSGRRGFIAGLDVATGQERWRFWTVPSKGQPEAATWAQFPLEWGGAPTWTTGSYDPETNLVLWPTGNPWPDFYGGDRPGDNLYSDCLLALDATTGKLRWYFQYTPHDTHDWDANETPVLLDQEIGGRKRKVVVQANRNGFYYVLDRITGEFLLAKPFVNRLNWASGVDPKGRPIEVPHMDPTPGGIKVCPSVRGATNWMSPSYNPQTGLLYVVTLEQCDIYIGSAKAPKPLSGFHGTGGEQIPDEPGRMSLRALSAKTGELVWEHPMPGPATMWAGTVATAGGLVFTGDDTGNLVALDAKTGEDLWRFPTGHTLYASPVTYSVKGRQYVTIAAESEYITFGLFEPIKSNKTLWKP
jgi:alcohol dehydrogenase (cytochrome c)